MADLGSHLDRVTVENVFMHIGYVWVFRGSLSSQSKIWDP